jgi:hypothetical protein
MFDLFFQVSYTNKKRMNYIKNKLAEPDDFKETPLVNHYFRMV